MGLGLAGAVKTLVVFWALLGWILTIRVIVENRPGSNRRHTKSDCRKLNAALARVRALPEIRERLISLAAELNAMTPDQLGNRLRAPYRRWRRLSSMAGQPSIETAAAQTR